VTTTPAAVLDAPAADHPAPRLSRFSLQTKTGERAALAALLVVTAVIYLWNITINAMGNGFYAAAVWAGSQNWEALLFGSIDPNNVITVDKPPLSQWVMALSGQIFGFSSASMLIPEALMAVITVWLLYAAVRRISGPGAGLLAGGLVALTPVVALMFRFNNPDAAMVLLMTLAAYFTVRALEGKGAKWMALAGVALGFAFLAKMLEGLMVMPALGLVYLIAAPVALRSRIWHLLGALASLLASAGWFVVLTLLWPASSRPYIAGSTDNNFMNLVLGYNGFGRVLGTNHMGHGGPDQPTRVHTITGEHAGHAAGEALETSHHHGFGGFGNQIRGLPRLFTGEFGFEIGWLVPAALLALLLVLISRGRAPRTDLTRAGAILFGGWMLADGLVLSFMKSNVHPYYCLSLAPAVTAMFAIGVVELWRRRESLWHRIGLAATLLTGGIFGFVMLGRNSDWLPALRWVILAATIIGAGALMWAGGQQTRKRVAALALGLALLGAVGGSAAYSIATFGQSHTGGGPSVGPADKDDNGHGWGRDDDNPELDALLKATNTKWSAAINRSSAAANLELATRTPVIAIGGFGGSDPAPTLAQFQSYVAGHEIGYYIVSDNSGHWGANVHSDIADWVSDNFAPIKVGSDTVYDLRLPAQK